VRYIDLDLLVGLPEVQPLIDAAEEARETILNAPNKEIRKQLIEEHRQNWVAFRPHFERIFGSKCWYTECKNPGTDDDVDHYRPKGRLAEDPQHGGYWWEALNWRNFRLSCHRANRLRENPETGKTHGKGDHFPLLYETDRCRHPNDDLCRERPTLLDPTDPSDPPLLTFDPDGNVALSPYYKDDAEAARRVEDSRLYLHLDWPAFREERQALYTTVYTKVLDGDQADRRFARNETGAKETLKAIARDLIRLAGERQPYSRAAQAYILRFRDREWVKKFVLSYIPDLPGR
jgi:hypothetical protein